MNIGFIVNPIAGMGGKVGLKGTDGVVDKAIQLGATPIAARRAEMMLSTYQQQYAQDDTIQWFTCKGLMGEQVLNKIGITIKSVVFQSETPTTSATDTKKACRELLKHNLDLLLFCGGDGTARDIVEVVDKKLPLLGIPSGVKMHSGVFGITPQATAKIFHEFVQHRLTIGDVEIMDLDETLYRKGTWNIKLYAMAKGIIEPTYVQVGKTLYESVSDESVKEELAEHIEEELQQHSDHLFLFGAGGTVDYIAQKLHIKNTLLGIDAIYKMKTIKQDLNETQLLHLLQNYPKVKLLLSPIGAQGFLLGRGNLQLTPSVIKKIGIDNIIIVATPAKLMDTPHLRVDTGDPHLDKFFAEQDFFMVIIGYHLRRVVKIQTNNF